MFWSAWTVISCSARTEQQALSLAPREALLPFTEENYRSVRNAWRDAAAAKRLEIIYALIFQEQYAEVVRLAEEAS